MKQITMIFRMIAVCAVLALFAGCSGGVFIDPGHGGATGGELNIKPSKLSSNAAFEEAAAKLEEIIAYCEKHPGVKNTALKNTVETVQRSGAYSEYTWYGDTQSEGIRAINALIDELE